MTPPWQPYREALSSTLKRNITIAIVLGPLVSQVMGGGLARWPTGMLMALWPSFGGHWVEVWFLNWLRPRIPVARAVQIVTRVAVWFGGGVVLSLGMGVTAMALARFQPARWPGWWLGGLAFIGVELIAQLALQLRGRPNFYNGRG